MAEFLKGKDVILLASSNYISLGKSKLNVHFIAEEFAKKGTKVLFVESLGLKDIPILGKSDWQKVGKRFIDFCRQTLFGLRKPQENLYIASIIRLPFDNNPVINKLNQQIITFFVKRYSKRFLSKKPLLWTFLPTLSYLKEKVPNSGFIYQNVDNYSAVPFVNKGYIISNERQTLRKADIVFTVSPYRLDEFAEYAQSKITYLNNVGNFEQFNKVLTEKIEMPDDLKKIVGLGKPIVGFVGNLVAYKEDVSLLTNIVGQGSDYSFVLIGGVGDGELITNILKLRTLPNVFFLGPKKYEDLYKYLKYFDVAIIPRRKNDVGEGGFPMKYFEFLAAGIPTIVTGVGTLKDYSKLARLGGIANNYSQFVQRIKYWVDLKKENKVEYDLAIKERVKLAKLNSWSKRIPQLNQLVSPIIK